MTLIQTLLMALVSGTSALGQVTPLPTELHADFSLGHAAKCRVPASGGNSLYVYGAYTNTDAGSRVDLRWVVRADQAAPVTKTVSVPLADKPVGLTPAAGETDVVYVATWAERSSELVLERWTLVPPDLIGSLVTPSGATRTTCTEPSVIREELIRDASLGPIWSMACNPFGAGHRLYLLRYIDQVAQPGGAEVWEFDVDTEQYVDHDADGVGDPLVTESTYPSLVDARDLFTAVLQPLGFLTCTALTPRWQDGYDDSEWIVLRDGDKDGVIEDDFTVDPAAFLQSYPYDTWDGEYVE